MPRVALSRRLLSIVLALVPALPACAGDDVATWELISRHLPGDALAHLGRAAANADRETRFARAVAQMDSQPVTEARLQSVALQLASLAQANDDIAAAAAYLIGRLHQVHFPTPDPARAAREFDQLALRRPASYWAQLGLVKLAVLQLYVLSQFATPADRLAAAEATLARLTEPALRRDLHIVLGRAKLFHGRPLPEVLEQLVAGDRLGGLGGVPRADLQLQIAELSRRVGDWPQASAYLTLFLAENEVDARAYHVKEKLAEVNARLRPPAAALP